MSKQVVSTDSQPGRRKTGRWKSGLWKKLVLLILAAGVGYLRFINVLTLESLARQETLLRAFQADHPVLVYGIAFLVYVAVVGLLLPGATALSLVYGWYFGWARGVILVSFASTSGATLALLLSRFLFRDAIQKRFGDRLEKFNRALEREGPFFLFTLRLIPAVPFFIINVVMGLTPIRARTFWWVSQLGMLPGTIVYIYAGSSVPSLQALAEKGAGAAFSLTQLTQIAVAFALLGLFPLTVRWGMKLLAPQKQAAPAEDMELENEI